MLFLAGHAHAKEKENFMVPMRDGVRLSTDAYVPGDAGSRWPAILIRSAYGKEVVEEIAEQLTVLGSFAIVVQDTRGRNKSEGTDCVFTCDASDGVDTVQWVRAQDWSNGLVATWGASALGISEYMMVPENPEGLVAMWAEIATVDMYGFMYPGGVFRMRDVESWITDQGSAFFLENVKKHPLYDEFWAPNEVAERFETVRVPGVHLAGWYDMFQQGTLEAFKGYQELGGRGAKGQQKLIVGPWTHGNYFGRRQGDLTYPENSALTQDHYIELLTGWMFHYLNVIPDIAWIRAFPTVQYYTMGDVFDKTAPGNEWRTSTEWPPPAPKVMYYMRGDGSLVAECPRGARYTRYMYDPANPSPSRGGNNLYGGAGPRNQSDVEVRTDLVKFNLPVENPIEITGAVKAHLWVSIDQPDTDIMVRLTDVYPDGRSYLLSDGAVRLATRGTRDTIKLLANGEIVEAVVELPAVSIILNTGHTLRALVTSSNAPRFRPNPNDGTSYGEKSDPRPVYVTLYHDADRPSYLEIPVPGADPSSLVDCRPLPPDQQDGGTDAGADSGFDAGQDSGATPDGGMPEHSGGCSVTGLGV
jgi:predicted acyl esterase